MTDWTKEMHSICEKLTDEISEMNKKIDKNGGKMSAGDLEALDKLTHALKSVKTTLAMEEHKGDYSNGYNPRTGTYVMNDGRSYGDESYARRRDSMGRYTSEDGYSRAEAMEDMAKDIRKTMPHMPEELKQEARHFLSKLEQRM